MGISVIGYIRALYSKSNSIVIEIFVIKNQGEFLGIDRTWRGVNPD